MTLTATASRQRRRRRRPVPRRRRRLRGGGHQRALRPSAWTPRRRQRHAQLTRRRAATPPATRTTSADVTVTVSNHAAADGLVAAYGFDEASGTDGHRLLRPRATPARSTAPTRTRAASTAARSPSTASTTGSTSRLRLARPDHRHDARGLGRPDRAGGWRTAILKERAGRARLRPLRHKRHRPPERARFIGAAENAPPVRRAAARTLDPPRRHLRRQRRCGCSSTAPRSRPRPPPARWRRPPPAADRRQRVWGEWFAGLIDEVRIYNRALTAAEIRTDMNAKVVP